MTDEIKPCIHAEVCAEGCDLEDVTECGYYRAERTCRNLSRTPGWLLCSFCGAFTKVTDATSVIPAKGCGNCGAKVVEEAE